MAARGSNTMTINLNASMQHGEGFPPLSLGVQPFRHLSILDGGSIILSVKEIYVVLPREVNQPSDVTVDGNFSLEWFILKFRSR